MPKGCIFSVKQGTRRHRRRALCERTKYSIRTIKMQDSSEVARRKLDCFAYYLLGDERVSRRMRRPFTSLENGDSTSPLPIESAQTSMMC